MILPEGAFHCEDCDKIIDPQRPSLFAVFVDTKEDVKVLLCVRCLRQRLHDLDGSLMNRSIKTLRIAMDTDGNIMRTELGFYQQG